MSYLGPGVIAKLAASAAVAALVADRIYPQYVREADRRTPYLVLKIEQVEAIRTFAGPCGLETADLVIAAVGATQKEADTIARAVQTTLDYALHQTWGSVTVQGCFLKEDGINDDVVTQPETEEILAFVKQLDFSVTYQNI